MKAKKNNEYVVGQRGKRRMSKDDRIYYTVIHIILGILLLTIIYPLIYIVSSSFSSPTAVSAGRVILLHVDL